MKIKDKEVNISYGMLNQIHKRNVNDHYDDEYMTGMDAVRKTVLKHFSSAAISTGPYMGVVLVKLTPEPSLFSKLLFFGDDEVTLSEYIIRVPEMDSHIPEPKNLEPEKGTLDWNLIQSHNIFRAASIQVSEDNECEPGDLVWVDYSNDSHIFLGKVQNTSNGAGPADGGNGGDGLGPLSDADYKAPPNTPFTPPQFGGGYIPNPESKGYFQGDLLSSYFHKIRAKSGVGPPSAATSPKQENTSHRVFDVNTRLKDQSTRDLRAMRARPISKGGSPRARDDLLWVTTNIKTIVNKMGALFHGGSWYCGVGTPSLKGLSEHTIGAAMDFHMGTTLNQSPQTDEHNVEVMKNRQDWVLYLKVPGPKTVTHGGRTWKAEKIPIHAVKMKYQHWAKNWKTITDGYYFNMTEAFNYFSMKGLGPLSRARWWKRPWYNVGEMWHYDHRETFGYVRGKTTVGDVIDAVNFPGYRTPAAKRRIPKYANAYSRTQVAKTGYFGCASPKCTAFMKSQKKRK